METKFNSQICTTREQSERLIALGIKKETADMCWIPLSDGRCVLGVSTEIRLDIIPSWSLHRLIEMRLAHDSFVVFQLSQKEDAFEKVISHIEHAIKEGYFDKEYLVDQEALEKRCKGVLEYLDYIRGEEE